ncbi:MAG: Asp23/Gls24 family envelope stress response protein [Lachnospiraceae bacterium]|nr:Asp23/Gls24 family envelope stress response protein [Lachnospiraceae bacterium]
MAAKYVTELGTVVIEDEVIARAAGMAALECYGVVGMAQTNVKDGIAQLLTGDTLTKGIKVQSSDEGVTIEFHIIVEYGTNISTIADNLMSNVKYSVKEMVGVEVLDVNVFVEGIRTEKP